jgi:hypothetical protein
MISRFICQTREIQRDWKRLTDRNFAFAKQQGWLVCGLHPNDGGAFRTYNSAEYLAGYSGVPPLVHLRRGEKLRRYLQPGLEDGKTFVFWGRNYNTAGIPGPERAHTWVNQPERLHNSREGAGFRPGQARHANAVYTYKPDFSTRDYREGVVEEDERHLVFEFYSPYIIAATPPNNNAWGIYDPGCRNGLVLRGKADCNVLVSTDQGKSWADQGPLRDGMDLTDLVKGRRQYLLRFEGSAAALAASGLTMVTVCQANASVIPHLRDGGSEVRFLASGQAVVSAGPNLSQAQAHVVAGSFGSPTVTLELAPPRKEPAVAVHAAGHVLSGNPPRPEVKYTIEVSVDGGKTWKSMVQDWTLARAGQEPKDFWSQSFCWGQMLLESRSASTVRVRFRNNGGRAYARCEAHLLYQTSGNDDTRVTFDWKDADGPHRSEHVFTRSSKELAAWQVPTGKNVQTRWVEFEPVAGR